MGKRIRRNKIRPPKSEEFWVKNLEYIHKKNSRDELIVFGTYFPTDQLLMWYNNSERRFKIRDKNSEQVQEWVQMYKGGLNEDKALVISWLNTKIKSLDLKFGK